MKYQKNLAALSVCVMMTAASVGAIPAQELQASAAENPMTAHEIAEDIVFGWNLGNTFDSYSASGGTDKANAEILWGNPKVTPELFPALRESGINAVRLPVTWYNHVDEDDVIDAAWLDRLEEVVGYILDADMYCIMDMHHDTGENGWLRASAKKYDTEAVRFASLWEQISTRFRSYDQRLLFEGYNELLNDSNNWGGVSSADAAAANQLNQLFVDTVRSTGGNNTERCLVVSTYAARYEPNCTDLFVLPEDSAEDRLIVDAHAYVPYNFTMGTGTTWSETSVSNAIGFLQSSFSEKGIPVIIGEFGCFEKTNDKDRIAWAKYYVECAEDAGIPCFWWDSGKSDYGLFNRRSLTWYHPDLVKTMLAAANGEEYVIPVSVLPGDIDLDETYSVADLVLMQKHLLGLIPLDADQFHNADVNEDGAADVFDLAQMKQMLYAEQHKPKNLISDAGKWSLYEGDAAGNLEVKEADAIDVVTEETGSAAYYMQAIYSGIAFEAGKKYTLTFTVSSEDDGMIQACMQEDGGKYTSFVNRDIKTTSEPKTVQVSYTPKTDYEKVRVNFNCGYLTGTYHITDISFVCQEG